MTEKKLTRRERQAEAMRKKWADPEFKAMMSKAMKEAWTRDEVKEDVKEDEVK